MSLSSLQAAFKECLFDNTKQAGRLPLCDSGKPENDQRLDIYRNNVFHSLTTALADLYPVIRRLTGDEFFYGAGRVFIRQFPPDSAAMVNFGSRFPEFLEKFEYASNHRWLADVARLELALHQSYHEKDVPVLSIETLKKIPPESLANSLFRLHPSVRLLKSPYPIYRIWLANQEGSSNDETIDLDSGGDLMCIHRPDLEVITEKLDGGYFEFLIQLSNGRSLEDAITSAIDYDNGFAADRALSECLSIGLFEKLIEDK